MRSARRFIIIATLGLSIALVFWLGSRYPDINAKAVMAGDPSLADSLVAWPVFNVTNNQVFLVRLTYTTLNWLAGNLKGMLFGVFFGSVFLTLIGYLHIGESTARFKNTFYGVLLGTPLGVCVNCAAPIFKGILQSKRTETAFAAMLASPTLNVVVLTMVFSLFPLYMGVTKVVFSLIAVFLIVPLFSWWFGSKAEPEACTLPDPKQQSRFARLFAYPWETADRSFQDANICVAIWCALKDLGSSLLFMIVRTVPLMVLAGILGALVTLIIPLESLTTASGLAALTMTAVIGTLLPVPIAMDVILANALYMQGLSVGLTIVLLCTLGIYSVYSMMITWQSTSKRWAFGLFGAFASLGIVFGTAGEFLHQKFYIEPNMNVFKAAYRARPMIVETAIDRMSAPAYEKSHIEGPLQWFPVSQQENITIGVSHLKKSPQNPSTQFTRLEGFKLGLTRGFRYGIRDYPDPLWIGRGTAAGDFNGDGWVDIAFGTNNGLALYQNRGGWFERHPVPRSVDAFIVYAIAFVDMDNDGWLDLFFTTFKNGNFIIRNARGRFNYGDPVKVDNYDGILTVSPAFADLDGNGYLDVLNGNMALGIVTGFHRFGRGRINSISFNDKLRFRSKVLATESGETMSTHISDINNDGHLDLLIGNDFIVPDRVYYGNSRGDFTEAAGKNGPFPATPFFSMSIDTADINNDLLTDVVTTGTIQRAKYVGEELIDGVAPEVYSQQKWGKELCANIEDPVIRKNCLINRDTFHMVPFYKRMNVDVENCLGLPDGVARQDCLLSAMWLLITNNNARPVADCTEHFSGDLLLQEVCESFLARGTRYEKNDFPNAMRQIDKQHMYVATANGRFQHIDEGDPSRYRHPGGWTWNTKFIDLNNDGYVDLFNAEGTVRQNDYGWNVYMQNDQQGGFIQKQFSSQLTSDFNLFSFAAFDFDMDGDIDIIGNSSTGPVQVYRNNNNGSQNSIFFDLEDELGNRFAIGSKIKILLADGSKQLREIKAGGGYQSFDPYTAHFGLGAEKSVASVTVEWPDGQSTECQGPFSAGHRYKIKRWKEPSTPVAH